MIFCPTSSISPYASCHEARNRSCSQPYLSLQSYLSRGIRATPRSISRSQVLSSSSMVSQTMKKRDGRVDGELWPSVKANKLMTEGLKGYNYSLSGLFQSRRPMPALPAVVKIFTDDRGKSVKILTWANRYLANFSSPDGISID